MAAYAALTSLLQILDQLERHPFPPVSLDEQQVESLTETATFLQEFLEGYDSPFADSDEADPLEMRIADTAYAAEDVIESYIVDNIQFAAAATHDEKVINSCRDELSSEQEISSNEGTASLDDEVYSCSGDEVNSEEEINSDEDASSGEETNNQKQKICRFFNCFPGSKKPKTDDNVQFSAAATHGDEVYGPSGDELNSEEEITSDEYASSGGASSSSGEETRNQKQKICRFFSCFRGSKKQKNDGKKSKNEVAIYHSMSTSDYRNEISCVNYSPEISCVSLYQEVWKVTEEMDLVKKEAMEMMREKTDVQAHHHQLQRNILRSSSFSGKNSSVMVGFDDVLLQLLHKLTGEPSSDLQVIPITGMGGIGKTTLARNIFQHALIADHFDICAWVTISQQYNMKEIIGQILSQASGESSEKSGEELRVELHKYLSGRKYLIIIDDIWSIKVWEEIGLYFPNSENGSRVVVTTRQSNLISHSLHMKFLDEVNSWKLFSQTVVGEKNFPFELEKIGKKIVKNCNGLPLSIVVIGGLLAKSQHTIDHWEQIEQKLNSIVNSENDEYCLKILKLSYNHLLASLKPCFLYMGSFEEDARILVSTLINLWICEGFIKPEKGKTMETTGKEFLKELIDRNLILAHEKGSIGNIKYCKMHDLLRDLCLKEAEKERFYHVIGKHSPQGIQNHNRRRMVFPRNFNEKVLDAWRSTTSHVRSFTFHSHFGAFGLVPKFRLLRILNADELGFPEYRLQYVIHELVNSRYVAFRNTKLPASVSFLWNLHTLLIVCGVREPEVIIAPVEIWKMSQLRHVEFRLGTMYLSDPPSNSVILILENLETLKGVVNLKCGEDVVKRIPNIKRLLINYKPLGEVEIHHGGDYCLSNLHSLHKLESLTIKVDQMDEALLHNITFPESLIKLSLESLNNSIGWEEMLEKIGKDSLPLLQKLKLEHGRFTTHMWETVEDQFPSLKFLSLHWCVGLEYWTMDSSHFPHLEHLHLSRLEELEEIPSEIGEIPTLQSIQLRYCSESVVKSAKKIAEEQEEPFLVQVWEYRKNKEALKSLESPNFKFKWSA